jgi:hypothetical protein
MFYALRHLQQNDGFLYHIFWRACIEYMSKECIALHLFLSTNNFCFPRFIVYYFF